MTRLRGFFLNLGGMAVLTYALYRLLVVEVPVLPWEHHAVATPSPSGSAVPVLTTRRPLRIGVGDRPAYLPLASLPEWMPRKGMVEIVKVPGTNRRWEMLAAGQLDLACGTLDSFALAHMHYQAGTFIFSIGTSTGEDVLAGAASFHHLVDLKHHTVAVPAGQEYLVGLALSQAGLSPSETTMVMTATDAEAATALARHAVDAALLWEPQVSQAQGTNVLMSTADPKSPRLEEMVAARPEVLTQRGGDVSEAVKSYFHCIETLSTKPGLAREPISRGTGLAVDQVAEYLKGVTLATLADNRSLDQALIASTMSEEQGDLKLMGKTVSTQTDTSDLIDLNLVKQIPLSAEAQTHP